MPCMLSILQIRALRQQRQTEGLHTERFGKVFYVFLG